MKFDFFSRKRVVAFLVGAVFGIGYLFAIFFLLPHPPAWLERILRATIFPLSSSIEMTDRVLYFFCDLFNQGSMCRGLGFDGGPLEWIEWVSVFVTIALAYGLLGLAVHEVADRVKSRKK